MNNLFSGTILPDSLGHQYRTEQEWLPCAANQRRHHSVEVVTRGFANASREQRRI